MNFIVIGAGENKPDHCLRYRPAWLQKLATVVFNVFACGYSESSRARRNHFSECSQSNRHQFAMVVGDITMLMTPISMIARPMVVCNEG